jgi:post-segregation antitoxin (ccd killing protein)
MRMSNTKPKRSLNLSISDDVVAGARHHRINMSEVAEAALRCEVDRLDRESLQARMDRTMDLWNEFNRDTLTVADEFGTL